MLDGCLSAVHDEGQNYDGKEQKCEIDKFAISDSIHWAENMRTSLGIASKNSIFLPSVNLCTRSAQRLTKG
jgi:hypothetical protein